ncbi:hypothetical protein MNBD_GAMMA23-1050 [hydrothermal vent metagenome]|uniref:DUF3828 domain-containing protein n=1 Tax=hydrothermal vent metagenome TaxID=652676 RepID=A0A3B0ZW30_9ZZZZ
MKKLFLNFMAALLLSSCASISEKPSLYTIYQTYISNTANSKYKLAENMLSNRNKTDLLKNSPEKSFSKHFPVLSSLHTVFVREIEHFESIHSKKACLTVSGFDSSKEPTSINFEFVKENSEWKLDYAQVMYHGSKKEFPKAATCPMRL